MEQYQVPPIKHNHVGHMTFTPRTCWCNECGQQWVRFPGDGYDPATGKDDPGSAWITKETVDKFAKGKRRKKKRGS